MNKRVEMVAVGQLKVVMKDIPEPPPQGMVVKIHYAGVCHSDVHCWENKFRVTDDLVVGMPIGPLPQVLGHEIAGEVFSVGDSDCPGAPEFGIGDLVLVFPWGGCEQCNPCVRRRENFCTKGSHYGINKDGGYQSYLAVTSRCHVQHLPDGVPMETACLLTCSALTTYNANRTAKQAIEDSFYLADSATVLIVGAGGLGLWALRWAKALYPKNTRVFMADVTQEKLDNAKEAGADGGVLWERGLSSEECKERTLEVCGGEIDVAFDYVNCSDTAKSIQASLRRGGVHVVVGLMGGVLPVPLAPMAISSKQLVGALTGTSTQMQEVADLVAKKKVVPPAVSIHKPEEAQELLEKLHSGQMVGRAALKFI